MWYTKIYSNLIKCELNLDYEIIVCVKFTNRPNTFRNQLETFNQ